MERLKNTAKSWMICQECQGMGKKSRRLTKKARLRYETAVNQHKKSTTKAPLPTPPKGQLYSCKLCSGTGLIPSEQPPIPDTENLPHVAIIGAGIGGVALAVACLHRGVPFTLYERDSDFGVRSQGYGLTLQQASKAIEGLGIFDLEGKVISTRHVVHTTEGKIIGEWGVRKWRRSEEKAISKRTNIHIARQSLREALLEQLVGHTAVKWGHQMIDFTTDTNNGVKLHFRVNGELKTATADLVVGADGIRSSVRKLLIGEDKAPLRYLDCIVILGICLLSDLKHVDSSLLDSATVFQTANGNERIYIMPYSPNAVMWQLSFPMTETKAKTLSEKGPKALKKEACLRTPWHDPIPQVLEATSETQITGYPVYDREVLHPDVFDKAGPATLIGDAAHPMSPFKGQGANQALLDALALARTISKDCRPLSLWKIIGLREGVLKKFESNMLKRSATKVKGSALAAKILHSKIVLREGNETRGKCIKKRDD